MGVIKLNDNIEKLYFDRLKEYANVVQVYSPDGLLILSKLKDIVYKYSLDSSLFYYRDKWAEIEGIFLRKENYVDLERFKSLESMHKNLNTIFQLGNKSSPLYRTVEWVHSFPSLIDYVQDLTIYHKQVEDEYLSSSDIKFEYTISSLRFANDKLKECKNMGERFKYLPLIVWSLENLIIYNNYSTEANDFVKGAIIPLLKRHRQASIEFIDLIKLDSIVLDLSKNEISESNVFNNQAVSILNQDLNLNFVFDKSNSLDSFTSMLETYVSIDSDKDLPNINFDLTDAKTIRRVNPLYSVYRAYQLAEKLDLLNEDNRLWEYILSIKLVVDINKLLDINVNTFSEVNIKFIILSRTRAILNRPVGAYDRTLTMWDISSEYVKDLARNMLDIELISQDTYREIQEYLIDGRNTIKSEQ